MNGLGLLEAKAVRLCDIAQNVKQNSVPVQARRPGPHRQPRPRFREEFDLPGDFDEVGDEEDAG